MERCELIRPHRGRAADANQAVGHVVDVVGEHALGENVLGERKRGRGQQLGRQRWPRTW